MPKVWCTKSLFMVEPHLSSNQAGCRAAYSRTEGALSGKLRPFGLTASQPRHASQMDLGIGFSPSR